MRLAWFSPWPPQRSGIAGRSAELVPELAARGLAIDVFVDERLVPITAASGPGGPAPGLVRIQSAHDFVWRSLRHQYDLVVYQIGNSRLHGFIWPYLFRWPGLTVLHDARLHHARGDALLSRNHKAAYQAEFAWDHPDVAPGAAELALAGLEGPYYFLWPMTRALAASSRTVAVHSRGVAERLRREWPSCPVEHVALGEGRAQQITEQERSATRAALGLAPEAPVFGVFGFLSAEKRIPQILRAFRTVLARTPEARLLLAGTPDPLVDAAALASSLGISAAVSFLESLDDEMFDRVVASVDVSLNLRWPTAEETSGPWLRALAAERATVVIDLPHQARVPALNPHTWLPWSGEPSPDPVTVAIDILDEDHSLAIAMQRLAQDSALRERLGRTARQYWEATHTVPHMVKDYVRVIEQAARSPMPTPSLPQELFVDHWTETRRLLEPFGPLECELF